MPFRGMAALGRLMADDDDDNDGEWLLLPLKRKYNRKK